MRTTLTTLILCAFAASCSSDAGNNDNTPTDAGQTTTDSGSGGTDTQVTIPDTGGGRDVGPGQDTGTTQDMGSTEVDLGPPPNPLDGVGSVELVEEGFQFTEGPRWYENEGVLRFTDIPANTIFELTEPDTFTEFTTASQGANGLTFNAGGQVVAAEHGGRRISNYDNGTAEVVVDAYEGNAFNSPNDLTYAEDGTLYFTDPPYGLGNRQREIPFNGLFRLAPNGDLTAEWEGDANGTRPNGVTLSPQGDTLYLADTQTSKVYAFDVASDGTLSGKRDFADAQNPDGMAIDVWGNLYVTAGTGIEVFAPDGTKWGTIQVPRQPANCAFGGADGKTLYITARAGLYRVTLTVEGIY